MQYEMESPVGPRVQINGRWRDYFSGCGYLGLQSHPGLLRAASEGLQRYGLGTATSRGGYGEHPLYRAVERAAADYWRAERAIYYVTAYLGNAVLLQGLRGEYERIFVDDASHYSVWDGVRAVGAPFHAFRHLDADDLAEQLCAHTASGERPLVISDGVFPISGEIAPAPAYVAALAPYGGGVLCLDDAHATGVLGEHGWGTLEHWGLAGRERCFGAHTLSKALGCHGGVIAGDAAFVEQLSRNAKALVGTSPSPLPAAAASVWALEFMRGDTELRGRLRANVGRARAAFRALGWDLPDSPVPIICLRARAGVDLPRVQAELFASDICVAHITSYSSTPEGGALRVAISAAHEIGQIDRLVDVLGRLIQHC
jgi:8-amino-7-oxononanoate synthase